MRRAIERPAAFDSWLKCCLSASRTMKQRKSRRQIRLFLKRKVVVRTTSLVRRKKSFVGESTSANLGGSELGDSLGAFGDGVLGEFTGEDEAQGRPPPHKHEKTTSTTKLLIYTSFTTFFDIWSPQDSHVLWIFDIPL